MGLDCVEQTTKRLSFIVLDHQQPLSRHPPGGGFVIGGELFVPWLLLQLNVSWIYRIEEFSFHHQLEMLFFLAISALFSAVGLCLACASCEFE